MGSSSTYNGSKYSSYFALKTVIALKLTGVLRG